MLSCSENNKIQNIVSDLAEDIIDTSKCHSKQKWNAKLKQEIEDY